MIRQRVLFIYGSRWTISQVLLRRYPIDARAQGCERMVARTHDFQAPEFYRKLGFVPACDVEYPQGHRNITFMKRLSGSAHP